MYRSLAICLTSAVCSAGVMAQDRIVSFYGLETLAKEYAESGMLDSAKVEIKSSTKTNNRETAVLTPGINLFDRMTDTCNAEFAVLEMLVKMHSYKKAFDDDADLKEYLERCQKDAEKIYDLVIAKGTARTDKKVFDIELANAKNLRQTWSDYCQRKGYQLGTGSAVPNVEAFLITDPANAKICMLSKFEYKLMKLRGKDADEALKKSVVGKTDPFSKAGEFVYMLEWESGKTSKVSEVSIPKSGKYTLK